MDAFKGMDESLGRMEILITGGRVIDPGRFESLASEPLDEFFAFLSTTSYRGLHAAGRTGPAAEQAGARVVLPREGLFRPLTLAGGARVDFDTLTRERDFLFAELQRNKADITALRETVRRLQAHMQAKDQLLFALVDSMFMPYGRDLANVGDDLRDDRRGTAAAPPAPPPSLCPRRGCGPSRRRRCARWTGRWRIRPGRG